MVICMNSRRYILLADMNAFFASCHQSVDPSLRNKPIIVGGSPFNKRKGMVIAASYEAKNKGIYTTMSMYEALKLCPTAQVVQRNHPLYSAYSTKIMDFLRLIGETEVASIDEAYVDITERVSKGETPAQIARYIQSTLWNKLYIPCSIGVGPNKIIAKMAADIKKPKGYVQMGVKQFCAFFHPQPVNELHGCGKKTSEKLIKNNINTIGQLAAMNTMTVKMFFGVRGELLKRSAQGISSNKVDPEREKSDKTIGKEKTFQEHVTEEELIIKTAREMIKKLAQRLKDKELRARTISVVYKKDVLESSHSRGTTLSEATNDEELILSVVQNLYEEHLRDIPLRLFGVRLSNLDDMTYIQLNFGDFC
jgi:DNA polymerase-4